MDIYYEYMVKHKRNSKDILKMAGLIAAGVAITVLVCIFYRYTFGMGFLLVAAAWVFDVILLRTFSIEYEYIMTNNQLDIDKVMSRSGRKSVISFDFKDIEICAPVDSVNAQSEYANTNGIVKTIDALGDPADGGIYFVDFVNDKGKQRILFQPKPEMIDDARRYNPRKIFTD